MRPSQTRIKPTKALALFVFFAVLTCATGRLHAGNVVTALIGATLIDGTGGPPVPDSAVIIAGDRITAAGPREDIAIPADAKQIDLRGRWLIPGLIDAHVHFFQSGGLYSRPDILDLRSLKPYEDLVASVDRRLEETFARYLASGVTSVIDMGGPLNNFTLRERAAATPYAPRIAFAGPLLATYAPKPLSASEQVIVKITTPEQARAEVLQQSARGPDMIKIWFVRPDDSLDDETRWISAAIDESHAAGLRVIAHATERRTARIVVEAGADVLAHSVRDGPIDAELLGLMKMRKVVYVATLAVQRNYSAVFGQHVALSELERRFGDPEAIASFEHVASLPAEVRPKWLRPREPRPLSSTQLDNLAAVARRGIAVAAGSDAGNIGTLHGPALHREMELLARALTPMEVLVAATSGGALAMDRADELGTIEPGKIADMVVLRADPLVDIRHSQQIERVVKGGAVVDPAEIEHWLNTRH